jgi:5'-3' exonuclease
MLCLIDADSFLSAAAWGREKDAAKEHLLKQIEWVVESTFATDYIMGVGDPEGTNFRAMMYSEYKRSSSRINSVKKRPEWFGELKTLLIAQPNVVVSIGCETDDLIRMWATQAVEAGDPFVVSSIDKDLDCIPGKHYDPRTRELYEVSEDAANSFYWQQILMGDSVDNIPGVPGIGPVKAKKLLAGFNTNEERRECVQEIYRGVYKDLWREYYLANAKMIHMWRYEGDHFTLNN